jgi:hypothetical protein
MSERHWRMSAPAAALALLAVSAAGCGHSAASTAGAAAKASPAAGGDRAFSASQLRAALLDAVSGQRPAAAAEAGEYGSLPAVRTSRQSMSGVKVTPPSCAQAIVTGFNSAAFTHAAASVVTFRVGRDGVSEVLVSASPQLAATALDASLPPGCGHYQAAVDGRTFSYSVRETPVTGLGEQARLLNVTAADYSAVNVWSVVYRGNGFVGAVTVVGPGASARGVEQLARDAYARAARTLAPA